MRKKATDLHIEFHYRMNRKKTTIRHFRIKLLKTRNKEKILKGDRREKRHIIHTETKIRIASDFLI